MSTQRTDGLDEKFSKAKCLRSSCARQVAQCKKIEKSREAVAEPAESVPAGCVHVLADLLLCVLHTVQRQNVAKCGSIHQQLSTDIKHSKWQRLRPTFVKPSLVAADDAHLGPVFGRLALLRLQYMLPIIQGLDDCKLHRAVFACPSLS